MPFAQKIALAAAVLSFPVILPFVLTQLVARRFPQRRQKFGFIIRVAVVSYSLAIAIAFFISTILRTYAPYMVTGHEPLTPAYDFLRNYEPAITVCILVLSAIGFSLALLPKRPSGTESP